MQPQKQIPIEGLLERYENALGEMGYTIMTKMHYVKRADIILHRHLNRSLKYFDPAIAKQYAPSTMYDVQLYMKKLYRFLHITGYTRENYEEFFSFKVNREKRVFPVLPKSDIAKLSDAIDRTTPRGKRDYAIMLLGTVLDLRACDVAAMKLTDIDWMRVEIRILQSKTAHSVILPLTQDVGEALKDYILNARPKSSD